MRKEKQGNVSNSKPNCLGRHQGHVLEEEKPTAPRKTAASTSEFELAASERLSAATTWRLYILAQWVSTRGGAARFLGARGEELEWTPLTEIIKFQKSPLFNK
jgi:hypothetical protein